MNPTPLPNAVWEQNKEIVELLINHGADVNAKNDDAGTPLHAASMKDNKEIVELLINRGADINAK